MIVITDKPGRLGNRLVIFAHFMALSLEYGPRFAYPTFDEYAPYFTLTADDLFVRFPSKRSWLRPHPAITRILAGVVDFITKVIFRIGRVPRSVNLVRADPVNVTNLGEPAFVDRVVSARLTLVRGWLLRCEDLVAKHATRIRNELTPVKRHRDAIDALMAGMRDGCETLIGVHIRHGDYRTFHGGRWYFGLDQYRSVMSRAASLVPGPVRYLICSDGSHDTGEFAPLDVVEGSGHAVEDMYALARCDYLLGPPSTFTHWASFYGEVPLYVIDDPDKAFNESDFSIHT